MSEPHEFPVQSPSAPASVEEASATVFQARSKEEEPDWDVMIERVASDFPKTLARLAE